MSAQTAVSYGRAGSELGELADYRAAPLAVNARQGRWTHFVVLEVCQPSLAHLQQHRKEKLPAVEPGPPSYNACRGGRPSAVRRGVRERETR